MRAERVGSVDALRGVLAAGVMAYHLVQWSGLAVPGPVASGLSVVSIYAVEAFFVVSGFSLQHVHASTDFRQPRALRDFWTRRLLRLAPLYLVALALATALRLVAIYGLHDPAVKAIEPVRLVLNASLLFGFVDPAASMVVAGWSVGVELVFYALFPALVLLGRPLAVFAFAALAATVYAASALDARLDLAPQWPAYTAWANHLAFFAGGMAIAMLRPRWPAIPARIFWPLATALAAGMAVGGLMCPREIDLVVGGARLAFGAATLAGVMLVARHAFGPGALTRAFDHLGAISYGTYLLHFFVYAAVSRLAGGLGPAAVVALSVAGTVVAGTLSHRWLELPALRLARRLP